MKKLIISVCIAILYSNLLLAEMSLFDFNTPLSVKEWRNPSEQGAALFRLTASPRFPVAGKFSLALTAPKWKPGQPGCLLVDYTPRITDWTVADRLVCDIINDSDSWQSLFLFISDSSAMVMNGLCNNATHLIPPRSQVQIEMSLPDGLKIQQVNQKKLMAIMRFVLEKPESDALIYINRMILLKPGEKMPALSANCREEIAKMQKSAIDKTIAQLVVLEKTVAGDGNNCLQKEIFNDKKLLDNIIPNGTSNAGMALAGINMKLRRIETVIKMKKQFDALPQQVRNSEVDHNVIIGFATGMEKLMPRDMAPELKIATAMSISLARNEKEAFQVGILPLAHDLKNVNVNISDLHRDDGTVFPRGNVKIAPMGYVLEKEPPVFGSIYAGWWPDPILDFMASCDVAAGDLQSFWVRCFASKDQPAGVYRGHLTVNIAGRPMYRFDLSVKVYDFALPDSSPLPLAITFWPLPEREDWKKHKEQWADFLADYYISYDSIYEFQNWRFDLPVLERLHRQGRLGKFRLGYLFDCGASEEKIAAWKKANLGKIRERYEQVKAAGILDHAYIYGCDEMTKETFPDVHRAAKMMKTEFPDVKIISSARSGGYGLLPEEMVGIDASCPAISGYEPELAEKMRAVGKQTWWYICAGPTHPWPNMFIEYPAIEGRLLMGAMTAKYRPDGFLYYEISNWPEKPLLTGPFTDWIPGGGTSHGDGSWVCFGKNYAPIATIRLENFRDGLEDYAYVLALERLVKNWEVKQSLSATRKAWLEESKKCLQVPSWLVNSQLDFCVDPASLYSWRNHLAQLIEAGVKE